MLNVHVGRRYNLSLFANSVLGSNLTDAQLVSILDYNMAIKFASVDLLHKQVYPYLPPGTLSDHTKYTYYLFKVRGKDVVVAESWIIADTIEETEGVNYTLSLQGVSESQVAMIRDQLRLLGIVFTLT